MKCKELVGLTGEMGSRFWCAWVCPYPEAQCKSQINQSCILPNHNMNSEKRQSRIIERVNFPNPELDQLQREMYYDQYMIVNLIGIGFPEYEAEAMMPYATKSFNEYLQGLVAYYQ